MSAMFRLIITLLIYSTSAYAGQPLPKWLAEELEVYRGAKNAQEYLDRSKTIHSLEKSIARGLIPKDTLLPELTVTVEDTYLTFKSQGLKVKIISSTKGLLQVDDKFLTMSSPVDMFTLAGLLETRRSKHTAANWLWDLCFPSAEARASTPDTINTICLSGWRQAWLSFNVPGIARSDLGYIPPIWIANLIIGQIDSHVFPYIPEATLGPLSCDKQVRDITKLMESDPAHRLALKDMDCGSEFDGSDRSMTFWTSDRDKSGKPIARAFSLDFQRGLAYDGGIDPDDLDANGDAEDNSKPVSKKGSRKTKKATAVPEAEGRKVVRMLYVFGVNDLHFRTDFISQDDQNRCEDHDEKDPNFQKIKDDIEPYRKIWSYMFSNSTCMKCEKQVE